MESSFGGFVDNYSQTRIKGFWRVPCAEQQCEKGIGGGALTIDSCSNRLYIMDIPIHKVI